MVYQGNISQSETKLEGLFVSLLSLLSCQQVISNSISGRTWIHSELISTDYSTQFLLTLASERYRIYFNIGLKLGQVLFTDRSKVVLLSWIIFVIVRL